MLISVKRWVSHQIVWKYYDLYWWFWKIRCKITDICPYCHEKHCACEQIEAEIDYLREMEFLRQHPEYQ